MAQPVTLLFQVLAWGCPPLPTWLHLSSTLSHLPVLLSLFLCVSFSFFLKVTAGRGFPQSPKFPLSPTGLFYKQPAGKGRREGERQDRQPETEVLESREGGSSLSHSLTCLSSRPASLMPSPRSTSPPRPSTSSSPAPLETSSAPAMCLAASGRKTNVCLRTSCRRSPCTGEARGLPQVWLRQAPFCLTSHLPAPGSCPPALGVEVGRDRHCHPGRTQWREGSAGSSLQASFPELTLGKGERLGSGDGI